MLTTCVKSAAATSVRWGLRGAVTDDVGGSLQQTVKWRLWAQTAGTATGCVAGLTADGSDTLLATGQPGIGQTPPQVMQAAGIAPASTGSQVLAAWPTQLLAPRNGAEVVVPPDPRTALSADASYQKLCFSLLLPAGAKAPDGALRLRFTLTAAPE